MSDATALPTAAPTAANLMAAAAAKPVAPTAPVASAAAPTTAPAAPAKPAEAKPQEKGKGKDQGKGKDKGGPGKKKYNLAETIEHQRQQRVARAAEDNVELVSRKTSDTGDYVMLLNSHDWAMDKVRKQMGRNPNLPVPKAAELIERSQALAAELNALNVEMFKLLNTRYEAPRRFRKEDPAEAAA